MVTSDTFCVTFVDKEKKKVKKEKMRSFLLCLFAFTLVYSQTQYLLEYLYDSTDCTGEFLYMSGTPDELGECGSVPAAGNCTATPETGSLLTICSSKMPAPETSGYVAIEGYSDDVCEQPFTLQQLKDHMLGKCLNPKLGIYLDLQCKKKTQNTIDVRLGCDPFCKICILKHELSAPTACMYQNETNVYMTIRGCDV